MEYEVIITLLTIAVLLLSVVVSVLLIMIIVVLAKVRKLTVNIDRIAENVAEATEWLSPVKIISELIGLFSKKTKKEKR